MKTERKRDKERKIRGYATAVSLALVMSGLSPACAYAGPASDIREKTEEIGPASAGPVSDAPTEEKPNGIVNPADDYDYDRMVSDLRALETRYPGKIAVRTLGQSVDGRSIYGAVVGNPNAGKKVLIQGAIHGREYIVSLVIMQQIEALLAEYETGSYQGQPLSSLLDQTAIYFVPMANPDGVAISQKGEAGIQSPELKQILQAAYQADTAAGRNSLPYGDYLRKWKSNGRGVNLNWNFNADWEQLRPEVSQPSFASYRGAAPESEPETQILRDLSAENRFSATVSYHARGRVVYWDTEGNQSAAQSHELAAWASALTGYRVLGDKGTGGYKDWLQRSALAVPSITIEVGNSECPVQFAEYPQIWAENKNIPAMAAFYALTH